MSNISKQEFEEGSSNEDEDDEDDEEDKEADVDDDDEDDDDEDSNEENNSQGNNDDDDDDDDDEDDEDDDDDDNEDDDDDDDDDEDNDHDNQHPYGYHGFHHYPVPHPMHHFYPYPYPYPRMPPAYSAPPPTTDYMLTGPQNPHTYTDAAGMIDPVPDTRRNRGGVTEPFPEKLHRMLDGVEREGLTDIVSFFSHGRAFAIHKPRRFVTEVMPRYFRQSRLTSFQRQLNLYGFRRISQGPDNGGYYHELFLKGRIGLCVNMKRVKVKGQLKLKRDPDTEPNFYAMPPISSVAPPPPGSPRSMPPTAPQYYPPPYYPPPPPSYLPYTAAQNGSYQYPPPYPYYYPPPQPLLPSYNWSYPSQPTTPQTPEDLGSPGQPDDSPDFLRHKDIPKMESL